MKILFAASEAAPFAKTGGLADVAGSLPPAIAALGHDVRVVMPRYRMVDVERFKLKHVATFYVPLGSWKERCDVLEGRMGKNVTVYFVNKDIYFDRPGLYGTPRGDYRDNAERYTFFSRSVPELCRVLGFSPDIVHCNDWQTGLIPLYLKTSNKKSTAAAPRAGTVFTIHNLGYQGLFWHWDMRLTGLGWEFFTPEGIEFWGRISFLKAGIRYADIITTVSEAYSREVQTPEYGQGMEALLKKRSADFYGIVNGIDYREWDPARDPVIARKFSASRPSGKAACKAALQKQTGLPLSGDPLLGMVTRLVDQKGIDILLEALPEILSLGVQLVILGAGDEKYHRLLSDAAGTYPDRMRALLQYDDAMARAIYAGCDLFLMPSRYEPCGLGQMIALRYGAAPLVRRTGGLADTVKDYNERTGRGTGFVFEEYSAHALEDRVKRAVSVYHDRKKWTRLMQNGMKQDLSWEHSAKEYVKIYRKAMKKKSSR